MKKTVRSEIPFEIGILTAIVIMTVGKAWLASLGNPAVFTILFVWIFGVMLVLSFRVVHHADALAVLLGEPYGTLILTLAAVGIEAVLISAMMLTGNQAPTMARDTMFSVLMIILNGMIGITLLIGGLRHFEQRINRQGVKAYLGVLFPLAVLGLVIPRFTTSAPGGQVSPLMAVYLVIMSSGLYALFLVVQTMRHSPYFKEPPGEDGAELPLHEDMAVRSVAYHAIFLILTMLPVILLSKSMAQIVDYSLQVLSAPRKLGGFLVAILVLSPEGLGAIRAALANRLQRTMNIALGSALSTIGMTIPAVLVLGLITDHTVELGLSPVDAILLMLTIFITTVHFSATRTNVLQGAIHLILFFSYVVLIFD